MMHEFVAGIHFYGRRLARGLGLVLLAGLVPACYSSSGKTYTPPGMLGGAGTLFSDGFVTYPNSGWTGPAESSATATGVYTPPFYFLQMADTARPGSASTTTTMSFSSEPLTFMVNLNFSATTTVADTASVQIVDTTGATVLAQAVLDTNTTGMITFSVAGAGATSVAFSAASSHAIKFQIDSLNNGTWSLDGTASMTGAFGSHVSKLTLAAAWVSSAGSPVAPTFQFGSVIVSTP
jgi:hypothetical protein